MGKKLSLQFTVQTENSASEIYVSTAWVEATIKFMDPDIYIETLF